MEWIKTILEKHTDADGKLNLADAIKEINKQAPENIVPKEKYNATAEAKKQLEKDVQARDKQLEDLKKAGSVEDLQKQLEDAQEANRQAKKDYDAAITNMKYDAAIRAGLSTALYPELMYDRIDRTKLKINEDDSITGLDEQIKSLKKTYADQFKVEKRGNEPNNPDNPIGEITVEQFNKMSYNDRAKLFTENKELYNQLTGGKENA